MSKKGWSKMVWDRAWQLEVINWRAAITILKDNDLLPMVMGDIDSLPFCGLTGVDARNTHNSATCSYFSKHAF